VGFGVTNVPDLDFVVDDTGEGEREPALEGSADGLKELKNEVWWVLGRGDGEGIDGTKEINAFTGPVAVGDKSETGSFRFAAHGVVLLASDLSLRARHFLKLWEENEEKFFIWK
jgi:hypothetical protein